MPLVLAWVASAYAASNDTLEIGGPWGTPGTTDGTSIWWNPAGLAAGTGTRFELEGAPSFGTVKIQRDDPHGGYDEISGSGVVPFFGFATDAGVHGLGLGAGLVVPIARDGQVGEPFGPLSFRLREGGIQTIYGMLGAGYNIADRVAVGVSGSYISSTYSGAVNTETLSSLNDAIVAEGGAPYSDALFEDPDYASTVFLGPLHGHAITFGAGVRVQVAEHFAFAVSYQNPVSIAHKGDALLDTGCPPESDKAGRFIIESRNLCDTTLDVHAATTLNLPMRLYTGFVLTPGKARIEPFLGFVGWHVVKNSTTVLSGAEQLNPEVDPEAASKVNTTSVEAKDLHDSVFFGVDGKFDVTDHWLVGGRVLADQAAVPDENVAPDNYDGNTLQLGGLLAFKPVKAIQIGASYTHSLVQNRTITNSAYSLTLDPDKKPDDRYYFAQSNGVYGATIGRLGIQLRGAF